jgi:MFS family permease
VQDQSAISEIRPLLEAEGLTRYLRHLTFFICVCTLFEGYDTLIVSLALPYLGRDFQVGAQTLGLAVSVINLGTIAAFFPVRLADTYGRRPVLFTAVTGYTLFTVATVFSSGIYDFIALQFVARMFMVTEIGVGSIMLTEELPARYRGRAIAIMIGSGLMGGIIGSLSFPWLVETHWGWRMLYLMGGVLLPLVIIYRTKIQETRRWRDQRIQREVPPKSLSQEFAETLVVFQKKYRQGLWAGTAIWFLTNFWSSAVLFFFAYYAMQERGWTAAMVGQTLTIAYIVGSSGYALAGPLLDFAGRKITACLYFSVGGISAALCFRAETTLVIAMAYTVVIAMNAVWAISATITSEIFPTSIRATANAVVNNLLGRTGMVLAPALVGLLSPLVGSVGNAVALLALVSFLCLPVVIFLLPETKRQVLEEIVVG